MSRGISLWVSSWVWFGWVGSVGFVGARKVPHQQWHARSPWFRMRYHLMKSRSTDLLSCYLVVCMQISCSYRTSSLKQVLSGAILICQTDKRVVALLGTAVEGRAKPHDLSSPWLLNRAGHRISSIGGYYLIWNNWQRKWRNSILGFTKFNPDILSNIKT